MRTSLLLAIFLAACAKAPLPSGTAVSKSGSSALSAFDDTKPQKEAALLQLAATALKAGVPLDASRAERCWREEAARPRLREICVLLWAGRGESSAELEGAALNGRGRILSLALLQRRPLIARLSWPELLDRIDSLDQDPLWARAELAVAWLEERGNPGLAEGDSLLSRIRPRAGAGPRDLAASLGAIRRLRLGAWQDALSAYCDPGATGEARLRCWRVLGALEDGGGLSALLPDPRDEDWKLFTLAFPRFAQKLRAQLR